MFKAIRHKKIFEEILDQIKELLITKKLKVGQKIPPELELSESWGISRSSVREALRVLDVLGIIEAKTGEGTIIKQADPENLKNIMSLVALSRGIDTIELFEVRTVIEMYSVRLAALNRTDHDLSVLKRYLIKLDDLYVNQEMEIESDFYFHRWIVEASKNKILVMLMEMISGLLEEQIRETRSLLSASNETLKRFQNQHWEIFQAIEQKQPVRAEKAVLDHLNYAQHELGLQPKFVGGKHE
ncbi:FadR/GntR family transcriptional regulator [Effusibacillus dendaii]|uniref:GntR family transcriptional regulator n=1 Tax=Effusibacillus dendaii TaxID=2743772 RepID=A0A7I8D6R5_9BACL|nr:FadR/GntR family transcriptional regulator [Effusibacillus dendaii]BCJ85697.1 GntR family transcriptional regulator [Effusibacillus dendaii]